MDNSPKRLDNGTVEIPLTLHWADIQTGYEKVVSAAIADTEISGFRKGKAPRNLVEPKLDKTKLYSQAVQHLLPPLYAQAIKNHQLHPLLEPHISLTKGEENQDWEFVASICEAPAVQLPENYKTTLAQLPAEPKDNRLGRIIEYLTKNITVKIPDLLVEEEANHRLAALVENITHLGLTTDNYLQAKKLTPENLKGNMAAEARADLTVEFILNQVQTVEALTDRKKTVDFLLSLV